MSSGLVPGAVANPANVAIVRTAPLLQLAIAWHRTGLRDKARDVLAGRWRPASPAERRDWRAAQRCRHDGRSLAWLARIVRSAPGRPDDWLVFRGDLSGRRRRAPGGPYLQRPGKATVVDDRGWPRRSANSSKRSSSSADRAVHVGSAGRRWHGARPHAHGRAGGGPVTGRLRWESPALNGLWYLLRFGDDLQREAQRDAVADGLRQRLWDDPSFGTLSSDGRCVFAIEDLAFRLSPSLRRPVVPRGRTAGDRHGDPLQFQSTGRV